VGLTDFLEHTLDHCAPQLAEAFANNGRRDLSFANPEAVPREGYNVGQLLLSARGYDSALTIGKAVAAFANEFRFDTVGNQRQWVVADGTCAVTLNFAATAATDVACDAVAAHAKTHDHNSAEDVTSAQTDAASAIRAAVEDKFSEGRPQPHSLVAGLGSILVSITPRTIRLLQTQGASEAPPSPTPVQPTKAAEGAETPAGKKRQMTAGGKKERPRSKSQRGGPQEASDLPGTTPGADGSRDSAAENGHSGDVNPMRWQPVPRENMFQLTLSETSGLTVHLNPDGSVFFARSQQSEQHAVPQATTGPGTRELSRTIKSSGDVVRRLLNGECELLRPDGTVARLTSDGAWCVTDFSGMRCQWTAEAEAAASATDTGSSRSRPGTAGSADPEATASAARLSVIDSGAGAASGGLTVATTSEEGAAPPGVTSEPILIVRRHAVPEDVDVQTREDGVILVGDADADHAVEFADGTRISTSHASDGSLTRRVECLGMPSVEIVSGHAPRLALTMCDGTIVQHEAQLGRCTILHTGGASLTLAASGDGSYTPGAGASPSPSDNDQDDQGHSRSTSASTIFTAPQSGISRLSEGTPRGSGLGVATRTTTAQPTGQSSRVVSAGLVGVALGNNLSGGDAETEFTFNFLEGSLRCKKGGGCEISLQLTSDGAAAESPASKRAASAALSSAVAPAFEPVVSGEADGNADLASCHRPHLFVIQRDGVMRRLLHRSEAAAYGRAAELEVGMDVVSRPVEGDLDSTVTTFVQSVVQPSRARQAYHAASVLPSSMQRHIPRPFTENGAVGRHVIVRQLCWHPVLTPERRDVLLDNLQAHQEWLQQEESFQSLAVIDTRDEAEKRRAASFAETIEKALVLQEEQAMLEQYVCSLLLFFPQDECCPILISSP
jgi:hypothetical protein